MTVTPREAEVIARDVLSTNFYANKKIFAISIIKQNEGRTLAAKSSEYFKKAFGDVIAEGNGYARILATSIATMSVISEVGAILGQPKAIITIHKRSKLMLLPMPSYDIVVGLVADRSSDVDNDDNIANKIQSLVATSIKPEKNFESKRKGKRGGTAYKGRTKISY
jgi:hypothetical protein